MAKVNLLQKGSLIERNSGRGKLKSMRAKYKNHSHRALIYSILDEMKLHYDKREKRADERLGGV